VPDEQARSDDPYHDPPYRRFDHVVSFEVTVAIRGWV
jgi:hypothetical protein